MDTFRIKFERKPSIIIGEIIRVKMDRQTTYVQENGEFL